VRRHDRRGSTAAARVRLYAAGATSPCPATARVRETGPWRHRPRAPSLAAARHQAPATAAPGAHARAPLMEGSLCSRPRLSSLCSPTRPRDPLPCHGADLLLNAQIRLSSPHSPLSPQSLLSPARIAAIPSASALSRIPSALQNPICLDPSLHGRGVLSTRLHVRNPIRIPLDLRPCCPWKENQTPQHPWKGSPLDPASL
jgi:hypothetical protein